MPVQITLRAARVNAGLTIIQAAKAIGVGKDRIIKWEKKLWLGQSYLPKEDFQGV